MKKLYTGLLLTLGLGIVAAGSNDSRADELYLKDECRIQGYSTYNSLSYYHLYQYYANVYLNLYLKNPRRNSVYLYHYFSYMNVAYNYYYAYWSQDYYLKKCQYPPKRVTTITYTSVTTSTQTRTAANGVVITYTQVQTSTRTATSTAN